MYSGWVVDVRQGRTRAGPYENYMAIVTSCGSFLGVLITIFALIFGVHIRPLIFGNSQVDVRRDYSRLGRLVFVLKSLQHRAGRATALSAQTYHAHGRTPLMAALQSGQYEAAAALMMSRARLDLANCHGWTAADFARDQRLPYFVQQGLHGDPSSCERICALADPEGYVEVLF